MRFISTFKKFLNEQKELKNNINAKFWNWFGDSKIVDNNPLVVYHATRHDFDVFDFKNSLQKIIWFTTDLDAINNKEIGANGYSFTKELYVSSKNPCGWEEYKKYGLGQLKEKGFDGCVLKNNDGTFNGFVFNSNQIKAVDNDGSFDIDDNNIYS
jgi:hypothetical protein